MSFENKQNLYDKQIRYCKLLRNWDGTIFLQIQIYLLFKPFTTAKEYYQYPIFY